MKFSNGKLAHQAQWPNAFLRTTWAANDDWKPMGSVQILLTHEGELPDCPGSTSIDISVNYGSWKGRAIDSINRNLRNWCTETFGPETPNRWRLMSSGFVYFADPADATLFWISWHQADMPI